MKYSLYTFAIVAAFAACQPKDNPDFDKSLGPINSTSNSNVVTNNTLDTNANKTGLTIGNGQNLPAQSINVAPQQSVQMPPNVVQSAVPQPNAKGLNPEHGKPGHRCDIAVGAPLSTPVQNAAAMAMQNGQNKITMTPTSAPANAAPAQTGKPISVTPAGMNPPHGEAGHRCDIAVGAPLNSAPAASTTAGNVTITPATTPPNASPNLSAPSIDVQKGAAPDIKIDEAPVAPKQ